MPTYKTSDLISKFITREIAFILEEISIIANLSYNKTPIICSIHNNHHSFS